MHQNFCNKKRICIRVKRVISVLLCSSIFFCSSPITVLADANSVWNNIKDTTTKSTNGLTRKANDAWNKTTKTTNAIMEKAGEAWNKTTETTDQLTEKAGDAWNKTTEATSLAVDSASKKAVEISAAVRNKFANVSYEDFSSGWNYYSKMVGSTIAAAKGQNYVKEVNDAIKNLETAMNNNASNRGIKQEKGFVAEKWHAETFNIDAIARGVETRAKQLGETGRASVDVAATSGEKASLKYYATAADSANEQAKNILDKYGEYCSKTDVAKRMTLEEYVGKIDWDQYPDTYWSIYKEQQRVIPKDQLADAKKHIENLIEKEAGKDGAHRQAKKEGYEETLKKLSDKIEASDGTKSIPLSKAEAEAIAESSKEGKFKPSDYGVTTQNVVTPKYIVNQSLKAGAQSAIIEVAMQTGPAIYQLVRKLIEEGKIDEDELKKTGFSALDAGTMGFLEGSVSNALLISCQAGKFGGSLKGVSPHTIGNLTVIMLDTFVYSYKFYSGQMTADEFADLMTEEIVVAVASQTAGTVAQLLIPLPGVYFAASLGASILVSANYAQGKEAVVALTDSYGFDMITPAKNTGKEALSKLEVAKNSLVESVPYLKSMIKKDYNVALLDIKTEQM